MEASEIPAIVGLKGIEAHKMMIIPHDEVVLIPNGGKITINMSKEVDVIKCIRTPSGHLLLPCDQYDMEDERGSSSSLTLHDGVLSACKPEDEPQK